MTNEELNALPVPEAPPPPLEAPPSFGELPEVPTAPEGEPAAEIDTTIDEDLFEKVPEAGAVIPAGKRHFRLDFWMATLERVRDNATVEQPFGQQPQFMLRWVCQEEPYVGYAVVQYVDFVDQNLTALVKAGDKKAKAYYIQRLQELKKITAKLGWRGTNVADFFNTNPEARLTLILTAKKTKVDGTYRDTGEKQNKITAVEPIFTQH
jgi:hypothetical protein